MPKYISREKKLEKVKQGPGTFVYEGGASDTEHVPGIAALNRDGKSTYDPESGKAQWHGIAGTTADGSPVMARPPGLKRFPLDEYVLWDRHFPKGETVVIDDESLAVKLRCMPFMREVGGDTIEVATNIGDAAPAPGKRGRRKKGDVEAGDAA